MHAKNNVYGFACHHTTTYAHTQVSSLLFIACAPLSTNLCDSHTCRHKTHRKSPRLKTHHTYHTVQVQQLLQDGDLMYLSIYPASLQRPSMSL